MYFVGDSNVLIHRDVLYRKVPGFEQPVVTHGVYCDQLRAETFSDDSGTPSPRVLYPLLGALALFGDAHDFSRARRDDMVRRHRADIAAFGAGWIVDADAGLGRPIVIVHAGNLDLRRVLLEIGVDAAFHYDSKRFEAAGFPDAPGNPVPFSLVRAVVAQRFEPLFRGLRSLRDGGITALGVHELQPPAIDDRRFAVQLGGAVAPAALRYKLTILINDVLERFCREEGLLFIDLWEAVTTGGRLDERFALDESHLNARAAQLTVARVGELLAGRAGESAGTTS